MLEIDPTISHYRIVEKIGEGGMGVVYKARDTHLDRFVATKVLPAEKVADPDRRRRFVQGAKAASAFNHPHTITIHIYAEVSGSDHRRPMWSAGTPLPVPEVRGPLRLADLPSTAGLDIPDGPVPGLSEKGPGHPPTVVRRLPGDSALRSTLQSGKWVSRIARCEERRQEKQHFTNFTN